MLGRVAHGANLDVGRTRRDADDHPQRGGEEAARGLHLLNHAAQHELRGVEVGNHAVLERTDGLDVRIGLLVHLAGLMTDGDHLAGVHVEGHDGGLVHHDLAVIDYQRIGRSEVDGQLLCQRKHSHIYSLNFLIVKQVRVRIRKNSRGTPPQEHIHGQR